jgi:multidrug efflux pump subunit AcrB
VWTISGLERSLVPPQDSGQIIGYVDASPTTSYAAMLPLMQEVIHRTERLQGVRRVFGAVQTEPYVGLGRIFIDIGNPTAREASITQMIATIQHWLGDVPGIEVSLKPKQDIDISVGRSKGELVYEMMGPHPEAVHAAADRLVETLKDSSLFLGVSLSNPPSARDKVVDFDRVKMGAMGVPMVEANNVLYDMYGDREITTIYRQAEQRRLIMGGSSTLLGPEPVMVRSETGALVDMRTFAQMSAALSPVVITHTDGLPSEAVSISLAPGVAMSQANREVATAMSRVVDSGGVRLRPAGTAKHFAVFRRFPGMAACDCVLLALLGPRCFV